ncbi:unnamed protein product [Echinostoma caproni]|uniref:Uncharacterized protein n=1 Tax=Echinostoma caproni TaxID=27848 RepID=A0A183AAJ7_9TREM|nr:unnamed protein product [Echinostoma caproni]
MRPRLSRAHGCFASSSRSRNCRDLLPQLHHAMRVLDATYRRNLLHRLHLQAAVRQLRNSTIPKPDIRNKLIRSLYRFIGQRCATMYNHSRHIRARRKWRQSTNLFGLTNEISVQLRAKNSCLSDEISGEYSDCAGLFFFKSGLAQIIIVTLVMFWGIK